MAWLRLCLSRNVKHHPLLVRSLTSIPLAGRGTVRAGQFGWGGFLPNGNGGARSWAQHGWQSCVERMGRSPVDCKTYKSSSCESRPK